MFRKGVFVLLPLAAAILVAPAGAARQHSPPGAGSGMLTPSEGLEKLPEALPGASEVAGPIIPTTAAAPPVPAAPSEEPKGAAPLEAAPQEAAGAKPEEHPETGGGHHQSAALLYIGFYSVCFLAAAAVECACGFINYKLPLTVCLFLFGLLLSTVAKAVEGTAAADLIILQGVRAVERTDHSLILLGFLPVCLYESASKMRPHVFRKTITNSLLLALPGVMLNLGMGAAFLVYVFGAPFSWTSGLMISSILSATDPVAVVAGLSTLGAPERLVVVIEGESLLNDGTGITFFEVFHAIVLGAGASVSTGFISFLRLAVVSSLFGCAAAAMMYLWLRAYRNSAVQVTGVISSIYFTCWAAEQYLHSSGVLATVFFGVSFSCFARAGFTKEAEKIHHHFVEILAYFANQAIFVSAGVITMRFLRDYTISGRMVLNLGLLYLAFSVARGLVVLVLSPVLRLSGYGVSWKEGIVMWWGGLRGAVALALALLLEDDEGLSSELRSQALFYIAGFTLLTLVINGTTFSFIYQGLGIYKINRFRRRYFLTVVNEVEREYGQRMESLQRHWLFSGTDAVVVANKAVPNLAKATLSNTGSLQLKAVELHGALSDIPAFTDWQPHKHAGADLEEPLIEAARGSGLIGAARQRDSAAAISEAFHRLSGGGPISSGEKLTHACTMLLTRIRAIYSEYQESWMISGESLLTLQGASDVAIDICSGDTMRSPTVGPGSKNKSWGALPFDAEMDTLKKSLRCSEKQASKCSRQDYSAVKRDLQCVAAFISAHEDAGGTAERSSEAIKSILSDEFFNDLRHNMDEAKAYLQRLRSDFGRLYDSAVTIVAAHMLLNEKQAIVEQFAHSGALLEEDVEKVCHTFEELHEELDWFRPQRH